MGTTKFVLVCLEDLDRKTIFAKINFSQNNYGIS